MPPTLDSLYMSSYAEAIQKSTPTGSPAYLLKLFGTRSNSVEETRTYTEKVSNF